MIKRKHIIYGLISLTINGVLLIALLQAYSGRKPATVVPATGILNVVKDQIENREEKRDKFSYLKGKTELKEQTIQRYRQQKKIIDKPTNAKKDKHDKKVQQKGPLTGLKLNVPNAVDDVKQKKFLSEKQYRKMRDIETKSYTQKNFLKTVDLSVHFPASVIEIKKIVDYFDLKIVGYVPENMQYLIMCDNGQNFEKLEGKEIADFYKKNTNRTIENIPSNFREFIKTEISKDLPDINVTGLHLVFLLDNSSASYFLYKQDLAMQHIGIKRQENINNMNAEFAIVPDREYYILKITNVTMDDGVTYNIHDDPELAKIVSS